MIGILFWIGSRLPIQNRILLILTDVTQSFEDWCQVEPVETNLETKIAFEPEADNISILFV